MLTRTLGASLVTLFATIGCGHGPGGKLMVDTPALPYQAPDIDEITGIDSDEEPAPKKPAAVETPKAAPAPTPAAMAAPASPSAPAPQKPATPAPAPAKK
jgi:hypothetical protein